ncbi:MAG: protein-disulfide reductase DsbD [Halieaceae bacterium]|jgi:thiol:disulfide interchange protein|nr:protein-disulfide reductase DsbD [Halieaceae bacterium]
MRAVLALLILLGSSLNMAQTLSPGASPFEAAASSPSFLPVEKAYQLAVEIQSDQSLRLYWQIEDEYYLYQHRFAFELSDAQGPIELETTFPPALERVDEYFGEVRVYYQNADISLVPQRTSGTAKLLVTSQGCADAGLCYPPQTQSYDVDFDSAKVVATTPQRPTRGLAQGKELSSTSVSTVLYMMLMAFLGGAILNLMPCVFPILSLKVLSFAQSTPQERHLHSWVFAAGVVVSFLLVAMVLIALQQAGKAVGWGFQLQSPGFVIALAYLFVAMGLSLSGLIQLGSGMMGMGSSLTVHKGPAGSFFTGVLAVVVASPCTAPFMGSALGFAMTQSAGVGLIIFSALGAGMAAPVVLLSYSPRARGYMPAPGAWMETLKQVLAFPLYATAIWLLWVAGRQTGVDTMAAALMGSLLLALGMWLWGSHPRAWRKGMALVCIAGALSLASWRGLDNSAAASTHSSTGKVSWSEQALDQLRAAGSPVFIDVTADWCITCIANEQAVLFTDEMTAAFKANKVVYMVADWTNYDPDIAHFLQQHGRNGIPLYLMYPADPASKPIILPQLLTKSTVLEAIAAVTSEQPTVVSSL